MCIATPGRVTAIDGDIAQVDVRGTCVATNVALVRPKIGDYVLVHAGMAIEAMSAEKAQEILRLFGEMEV